MYRQFFAFCIGLCFSALSFSAQAQTESPKAKHLYKHQLSFFSGATSLLDHPGTSNNQNTWHTIGLDYEFRINQVWGVSAFVEYLFASHEEFLVGLPVYVHPWRGLKFNASPLMALVYESKSSDAPKTWHNKFGYRIEAGYSLKYGNFILSPLINFDSVEGHPEINYGLAFGLGF